MEYIRQTVGDSKVLVCEITCYRLLTIYCVILTSPSSRQRVESVMCICVLV